MSSNTLRRARPAGAALCLAVQLAATLSSGAAETVVDGWTVKPFVIDGRFDRCNANAPSRDLAIVLFADGRASALVADQTGAYKEAQIEVDVDLDGQLARQVPAVVVADQLFLVALGNGPAALDRLSKASVLRIKTGSKSYTFDLKTLPEALKELQNCVSKNGGARP